MLRIFSVMSLLWLAAFLIMLFFFPLIEPQSIQPQFSLMYAWNFFYGMSLYIILISTLSTLVYIAFKPLGKKFRIFAITYFSVVSGVFGSLGVYSVFKGNPGYPLWMILIWRNWWFSFTFGIVALYSLMPGAFSVLIYEVYRLGRKWTLRRSTHKKV